MEIRTVAVLGAGAVGSYIIQGLSAKPDIDLGVIATGKRAQRLQQGCKINGVVYHPKVWSPQEAKGVDLLIVALKYGALAGAIEDIKAAVGENTIVMSLMNGVDSEEIIGAAIGREKLIYSLIKIASCKKDDEYIFDTDSTIGIIAGELSAPFDSERIKAVAELFAGTSIRCRMTEHIEAEIWSKFRINVCNNLPQAVLGAGLGCYKDSQHMKFISRALGSELMAIANAKGVDISLAEKAPSTGVAVSPATRFSTLQDLDAGRHTEIDMFSGALIKMGQELGIPTPFNEYTYHIIKALEEKNDGLFDYDTEKQ